MLIGALGVRSSHRVCSKNEELTPVFSPEGTAESNPGRSVLGHPLTLGKVRFACEASCMGWVYPALRSGNIRDKSRGGQRYPIVEIGVGKALPGIADLGWLSDLRSRDDHRRTLHGSRRGDEVAIGAGDLKAQQGSATAM
jgi:hypothetical protein